MRRRGVRAPLVFGGVGGTLTTMECQIDWNSSKVENGELSVKLHPAPDFAFMKEFDGQLIQHEGDHPGRWGTVMIAEGKVVVGDVQLESARELRAFLDEAVREANRLAPATREREHEEVEAAAAAEAAREAEHAEAERQAAESDARLTDEFRGAA